MQNNRNYLAEMSTRQIDEHSLNAKSCSLILLDKDEVAWLNSQTEGDGNKSGKVKIQLINFHY